MKHLIFLLLASTALAADRQSLVTPNAHITNLTVPANSVTSNAANFRTELSAHGTIPTAGSKYWTNIRPPNNDTPGMGFRNIGVANQICFRQDRYMTTGPAGPYNCVAVTDQTHYRVRFQRVVISPTVTETRMESWDVLGGNHQQSVQTHGAITDPSLAGRWDLGGDYGAAALPINVEWVKVFSTVVPVNSAPPKYSRVGDILDFNFNGAVVDRGPYSIPWTIAGATYMTTPAVTWPAPVCNAGASSTAVAGADKALNGSASYSNQDNDNDLSYVWSFAYGPTVPRWKTARTIASPTIAGTIGGAYNFSLTVTDSASQTATCSTIVTTFPERSANTATTAMGFILPSGAASARCSVKTLSGSWITTTASTSPCLLASSPSKLSLAHVKVEYLDSGGSVIGTSGGGDVRDRNPVLSYAKFATPMYQFEYESGAHKTAAKAFYKGKYELGFGGGSGVDMRGMAQDTAESPGYIDGAFYYDSDPNPRIFAEALGLQLDDVLYHVRYDITVTSSGNIWALSDMFDKFECSGRPCQAASQASKGVFVDSVDKTTTAYTGAAHTVNTELLIGNGYPFDEMNFVITTGAAAAPTWQFWNGTEYATLTLASDTTSGMTASGKIRFVPPATWARKAENGSLTKYWVRMVPGSGTKPVFTTVKGDSWLIASGTNNARGWDPTHASRVNVGMGELEYNPTPPSDATAKFRHQARATGIWTNNSVFYCHACVVGGVRVGGAVLAAQTEKNLKDNGNLNGWMWDDAGGNPAYTTTPTYLEVATASWADEALASLIYAKDLMKTWYPGLRPGANTGAWSYAQNFEWIITEQAFNPAVKYDAYDPTTRPVTITMSVAEMNDPEFNPTAVQWYPFCLPAAIQLNGSLWDRNRGLMNCLAMYYLGKGPNTGLILGDNFSYRYRELDSYNYYHTGTTLTGSVTAGTDAVSIPVASTAGCVASTDLWRSSAIYTLRIGDLSAPDTEVDVVTATLSGSTFTSGYNFPRVYHSYTSGTPVYCINPALLTTSDPSTRLGVWRYANWFPPQGVNVGQPAAAYTKYWKNGVHTSLGGIVTDAACTGVGGTTRCGSVSRRDFAGGPYGNVMVLLRGYNEDGVGSAEHRNYSTSIDLGGTWYPLLHTGKTGEAITSIQLRAAESAILLSQPIE